MAVPQHPEETAGVARDANVAGPPPMLLTSSAQATIDSDVLNLLALDAIEAALDAPVKLSARRIRTGEHLAVEEVAFGAVVERHAELRRLHQSAAQCPVDFGVQHQRRRRHDQE